MQKGNIAVFITDWDRDFWKLILEGIQEKAIEEGYAVSVFNCRGNIDTERKFDLGEFQIFELANFEMYDGVILVSNSILPKEILGNLFRKVKKYKIPAISLEIKEDGVHFLGIDNYAAMREMVEHLVEFHKYDSFGFIKGPDGNQESEDRYRAYVDVLKEHNIAVDEDMVFHGTYEFESGLAASDFFANKKSGLPKAIVSSNDQMAMGLILGLEKYGIKVPRDVAVTGFDDIDEAYNFDPRISSVVRPKKSQGKRACEYIIRAINGEKIETHITGKTKSVFRESCGCCVRGGKSYRDFRHEQFIKDEMQRKESALLDEMTEMLADCNTFDEWKKQLNNYISFLGCKSLYICVNPSIYSKEDTLDNIDFMGDIKSEVQGITIYSDVMNVLAAYDKDGKQMEVSPFQTKHIVPTNELDSGAKTYLISPIHFQDHCLGYCIVVNPDSNMNLDYFCHWLMIINTSIENIRRKNALNVAMKRLEEMYIRDGLTNIYNRFGFIRFSEELYATCKKEGKPMLILFADLNDLKHINDDFGHEEGDIAIKAIAQSLIDMKAKDDVCTRFGGDEFILMGLGYTASDVDALIKAVKLDLEKVNVKNNYPFEISASMGYYIVDPKEEISLEDAINIADQNMYQEKKKWKNEQAQ